MGSIVIDEEYDRCLKLLKESISNKRFIHSIGVSNTAACLAMRYGFDIGKAYMAGLLHDCAKGLKSGELIELCERYGIEITALERENPELLHSKAGSIIAKEKYGIEDDDIASAVFHHTTGRPGMTDLEKIIFVADYIEPNRVGLPGLEDIRREAFSDIDCSVASICRNTLDHLKQSAKAVDRATVDTYEYYRRD